MLDTARFLALPGPDRDLAPEECAALARLAAELVELSALERRGAGSFELLWRNEHSEAWLNLWWEPRDTGFHDHGGSCVGVHVLEGRARNEALVVGGPRRVREYAAGESFTFPGDGIHRMEHEQGAVTIHVYSPPITAIGHYDLVDGELRRTHGAPDEGSPPSPGLSAALEAS
ncbi:MAG TPA: cysteine dioxygenase family protein [Gaiellaceae bacterium]|nr:cysteine dioxygenase family protein [Gaiellaceae bacterium]